MHICDGFAREYCNGSDRNNSGNIHKILAKIKKSKYTEGAVLLGMPSNMALDALCQTRNELTHYIPKAGSLGSFIDDSDIKTDGMVNLYVFYVLETALRVAVLEQVDFHISEEIKEYIMDAYLDWIRLENDLDEECVIPGKPSATNHKENSERESSALVSFTPNFHCIERKVINDQNPFCLPWQYLPVAHGGIYSQRYGPTGRGWAKF